VRELKHAVERAALLTDNELIDAEDLGLGGEDGIPAPAPPRRELADDLWDLISRDGLSLAEAVTHCERAIIDAALRAEDGNRTRAAERLSIHVRTIFKKLQQA
jgi:DNA-binding NtrC family response regulator